MEIYFDQGVTKHYFLSVVEQLNFDRYAVIFENYANPGLRFKFSQLPSCLDEAMQTRRKSHVA